MSDTNKVHNPIITSLAPQLGTAPKKLGRGEIDYRLLSYIVSPEKIPESFKPVLYMLTRRDVVTGKKRFWDALSDNYLTLLNSIDGRGIANILKAESVMKGMQVNTDPVPQEPGFFDKLQQNEKYQKFKDWEERKEIESL